MSQMNIVLNQPISSKPIDSFNMNSEEGKMFVGGIKPDTQDEDFRNYFSKYGELTDCVLMKDPVTEHPRGFGFIRYKDPSDVSKVLAGIPHFLNGKRIDPKQCLPRNVSREMSRSGRGVFGTSDAPLSQKIFIGGVGQTSEEDIQKAFSRYGNVIEVVLMMDKTTGNCRGFGFVTFDSEESVAELCEMQYVTILDKRVEIKKAQPRDSSGGQQQQRGGPPGFQNSGPPGMNQHGGPPGGMGGPGGPPMGQWNHPQNTSGYQNQGPGAGFGGQGGFNQQNSFGGGWNQPQQPMGNYQQNPAGSYSGQQGQQQQPGQQQQQGGYSSYGNQNAGQGGNNYGQQPQNYGGQWRPQQQQQQQPTNNYGSGQQNYGGYSGYGQQQQQQQQQQQPNMYGNQGGGDAQQAYGGQQNYSNPPQQQQGNMGNYAQEASGYGPQKGNFASPAGYNQPPGQGGYSQPGVPGNYNGQQQQQQQPMQQQQQPQQRHPMQQQQQPQQQPMQQQQGNYGQQPPGVAGPPGTNYQQQQRPGPTVQQAQTFHPYRR